MLPYISRFSLLVISLLVATKVSDSGNSRNISPPSEKKVSILFAGDIMQHGPQITGAWNDSLNEYDYHPCFKYVSEIVMSYDLAVANLELTLAGEPYTGYPQFSAPDELAVAIKNSGFDILVTANNHSCDRGDKGLIRTTKVLDSLGIKRTGTFYDSADYTANNPLILNQNGISIALLNYTYGTNGLPFKYPAMVNMIDEEKIISDIALSKTHNPDFIIVYYHWGNEYELTQSKKQEDLAKLTLENGVDAVIGSHPHVIQPFMYTQSQDSIGRNQLVVYSLGNYVSNQRDRYRDGGAMVGFTLSKTWNRKSIIDPVYHLSWVHTPIENGKKNYYILPVNFPENELTLTREDMHKKSLFINDTRERLNSHSGAIPEASYTSNPEGE
jgi:poly-gamma-glutamate synthesis protein (capsule biosynthesis protein)